MAWYTVSRKKNREEWEIIFDGKDTAKHTRDLFDDFPILAGERLLLTRGKGLGKFVAERAWNSNHAGVMCDCGGRNTIYTGHGGFQEADASRETPMMEGELVACNDCGREFWY